MSSCTPSQQSAAFKVAVQLLGDDWVLRIIAALEDGPARFCQIERSILASNPVTLTDRLKKLEHCGLVSRQEGESRSVVQYSLTVKGRGTLPILHALNSFAHEHLSN